MTDREKVIKGVECHRKKVQTTNAVSCLECPYSEPNPIRKWCMRGLMDDIYALLKEQEPKPVGLYGKDDWYGLVCVCPDCKAEWMGDESETHCCPNCGRRVKWE